MQGLSSYYQSVKLVGREASGTADNMWAIRKGCRGWTAASALLVLWLGEVSGFAPMGAGVLRRSPALRSTEAAVLSLQQPRSAERARMLDQLSARRSTAVHAAPKEAGSEVIAETLKQSCVVEASMEDCFEVASDLDSYRKWCAKGGMKQVEVVERLECGKASKVKVSIIACGRCMRRSRRVAISWRACAPIVLPIAI